MKARHMDQSLGMQSTIQKLLLTTQVISVISVSQDRRPGNLESNEVYQQQHNLYQKKEGEPKNHKSDRSSQLTQGEFSKLVDPTALRALCLRVRKTSWRHVEASVLSSSTSVEYTRSYTVPFRDCTGQVRGQYKHKV